MVSVLTTTTLLLVVIIGVSCQLTPLSDSNNEYEGETPIAERRKFTDVKKFKFLPTIKKPKSTGWLPSFFTRSEVTEAPLVHELAPLSQYPIWKVHKYKGIELRPVPVIDAPRTLDVPVVRGEPPQVIDLPQYGPPVAEYGVPAAEYGPPRPVYGVPAKENVEVTSEAPLEISTEKSASEEETQSSLDALSNLGTLTSLLGEGDANNLARLQFILQLFRSDKNLFTKLKNLKSWKFPTAVPQSAPAPPAAPVNALYLPSKKESKSSLLSSFIPSFLRSSSAVPLPNLPEVEEIPVNGLENVRIQLPELPPINLPAYTANYVSGPYVKVKVGNPAPVPVSVPAPAPIVAAPVVQESYYQPPVLQYQHFPTSYVGNTPLYNSYGVAIPVDSYSIAASDQAPQYAAPAQNQQEQAQLPQEHFKNFKNESIPVSQEQPIRNMEYDDTYDMQMEEQAEIMDPRTP